MEGLVELKVLGVSCSEVHSGAYALILEELDGSRRVPIVIGATEAQSIMVRLQEIIPVRPLTHDLMCSVFHAFGIELSSVIINEFKDGVFTSLLNIRNDQTETKLDSRTSDAVAMALRTGARIYATAQVMAIASYDSSRDKDIDEPVHTRLEDMPIARLKAMLQQHVDNEEYEQAAEIQKIIESRTAK
ncbi:MAG: bifunctional nuclease family protein [Muribaculaceae bacterium]|nr:bifunctional nuclease family protein [Muribaculaceae bacterium]